MSAQWGYIKVVYLIKLLIVHDNSHLLSCKAVQALQQANDGFWHQSSLSLKDYIPTLVDQCSKYSYQAENS